MKRTLFKVLGLVKGKCNAEDAFEIYIKDASGKFDCPPVFKLRLFMNKTQQTIFAGLALPGFEVVSVNPYRSLVLTHEPKGELFITANAFYGYDEYDDSEDDLTYDDDEVRLDFFNKGAEIENDVFSMSIKAPQIFVNMDLFTEL